MDRHIELSARHMTILERNGKLMGATPSAMIGRLVDDEFGGLLVTRAAASSFSAIQQHIRSLVSLLRDQSQ